MNQSIFSLCSMSALQGLASPGHVAISNVSRAHRSVWRLGPVFLQFLSYKWKLRLFLGHFYFLWHFFLHPVMSHCTSAAPVTKLWTQTPSLGGQRRAVCWDCSCLTRRVTEGKKWNNHEFDKQVFILLEEKKLFYSLLKTTVKQRSTEWCMMSITVPWLFITRLLVSLSTFPPLTEVVIVHTHTHTQNAVASS